MKILYGQFKTRSSMWRRATTDLQRVGRAVAARPTTLQSKSGTFPYEKRGQ